MTIQQLDNKYSFDRTKVATASKKSYYTVINFFKGASTTVSTAAAIINVLPITALERAELIATMFQPDGKKGAREAQAALDEALRRMEEA